MKDRAMQALYLLALLRSRRLLLIPTLMAFVRNARLLMPSISASVCCAKEQRTVGLFETNIFRRLELEHNTVIPVGTNPTAIVPYEHSRIGVFT